MLFTKKFVTICNDLIGWLDFTNFFVTKNLTNEKSFVEMRFGKLYLTCDRIRTKTVFVIDLFIGHLASQCVTIASQNVLSHSKLIRKMFRGRVNCTQKWSDLIG